VLIGTRVLVLSERADDGLVFDGQLSPDVGEEPLATACIRELRRSGFELHDGDVLFFPDAAPGHRKGVVR
jgi:hypothetical protein